MANPPKQYLTSTDYTIACICPLGIELAPVLAMLDEEHDPILTMREQNVYTLGRIGQHNVVVTGMPQTGNNIAAVVATQLLNDFPSIRFALLVGIGGAVPGEEENRDIRLGDVVVSHPSGTFGGVVQYDLGKRLPDGRFQRTGSLNKPPAVLSAYVVKLQARHLMSGSRIPEYLSDMTQRFPEMQKKYSLPHLEHDDLFVASYPHKTGATCQHCDRDQIVVRPDREDKDPNVHYGTIGSANIVVKDSIMREALRKDMDVTCVEMEAAGLMDSFPCLVVRGIADYADSHKNKRWQPYAAAVAACYMKELLEIIPAHLVLNTQAAKEVTVIDRRTHELLTEGIRLQRDMIHFHNQHADQIKAEERKKRELACHQAFKSSAYEQHKNRNPDRVPGTCRWVLEHSQFKAWQDTTYNDLLWISADPGCGKSVLAKSLVDDDLKEKDQYNVCYFFFKDNEQQDHLSTALCAILHQLFGHQPHLISHAMPAWEQNAMQIQQETDEMWRILTAATADSTALSTICVIDALDECRDGDRRQFIKKLCDWYQANPQRQTRTWLKFLVTSRPYDNVQRWFEPVTARLPHIRIRGEDQNDLIHEEINLVIDRRVSDLVAEFKLPLKRSNELQVRLKDMKHRTYLWLFLAIEGIRDTCRDYLYDEELQIAPLPSSVNAAYSQILNKISDEQRSKARKILLIIVGTKRPLSVREMAKALSAARAFEQNRPCLDEIDDSRLERQIRQLCGLFVFINHSKLFLIHQTAKEFLLCSESPGAIDNTLWKSSLCCKDLEREMGIICVEYLHLARRAGHDSFFSYCAHHWATYLVDDAIRENDKLKNKVVHLYNTNDKLFLSWSRLVHWRIMLPQHLMARNGHAYLLEELYGSKLGEMNARDAGLTTLVHAARGGHRNVVQLLLDRGANANVNANADDRAAIQKAIRGALERGDTRLVDLLLDKRTSVDSRYSIMVTVLVEATRAGDEDVVQILLDRGVHVDAVERISNATALYAASECGNEKMVQFLLDHGADANRSSKGKMGTALQVASRNRRMQTMQILLDNGAGIDSTGDCYHGTALHEASLYGYTQVVQYLLDKRADFNARAKIRIDSFFTDSLVERVRRLIKNGAEIASVDELIVTPLHAAFVHNNEKSMQLLLDRGAAFDVRKNQPHSSEHNRCANEFWRAIKRREEQYTNLFRSK